MTSEHHGSRDLKHANDPEDVILLRTRSGRLLADIRSSADSHDAGEAIAELLDELHNDPDVELHCSLAGGRKTMGALC